MIFVGGATPLKPLHTSFTKQQIIVIRTTLPNSYSRITRNSGETQTVCQIVVSTKKLLLFIQA